MTSTAFSLWLHVAYPRPPHVIRVQPRTAPMQRDIVATWDSHDTVRLRSLITSVLGVTAWAKPPRDTTKASTHFLTWVWWTVALVLLLHYT